MPLAMQMVAILVCALVAAQAVTLALTVILPPHPTERWDMDEVADALAGRRAADRLDSKVMAGPPDVSGQGWLVSESSRDALAQRIGSAPGDVVLAFYTQLPVGGVAVPSDARSPLAVSAGRSGGLSAMLITQANAQAIPGGPPAGGRPGPAGMPGGGFPGGRMPGGHLPGGGFPGGGTGPHVPSRPMQPGAVQPGGNQPGTVRPAGPAGTPSGPTTPARAGDTSGAGEGIGAAQRKPGALMRPGMNPGPSNPGMSGGMPPAIAPGVIGNAGLPTPTPAPVRPLAATPVPTLTAVERPEVQPTAPAPVLQPAPPVAGPSAQVPAATTPQDARPAPTPAPLPIPFRRTANSLFDAVSPPFIEGDFVAAARQKDGTWLAVAPRAEPFPNAWQTRVMLWFALSLAIVSPLAWLFVRRIVVPLRDFAKAAEQLGRDPSATILPLSGPAEIGRAANAFNQMRNRLRAFVDDRTAMVGAISHDLRTPLTRLRFRIEDVPDDQREGLLKEVTEMEAMISQVIAFIRDASTPGPRQRLDFADLIAGSVADWQLIGADVEIERNAHIPVEVDPVGIRRLLGNLLENAVKYGESARVRVTLSGGEAVAEIIDAGLGIPEDEFDRAFEPFYRSDAARRSGRKGSGLGLAVCRSIARAHGGDVSFAHGRDGFVARVTVPAAFVPTLRKVA